MFTNTLKLRRASYSLQGYNLFVNKKKRYKTPDVFWIVRVEYDRTNLKIDLNK